VNKVPMEIQEVLVYRACRVSKDQLEHVGQLD